MAEGCEIQGSQAIELNSGALLGCFLLKFGESVGTNSEENPQTLKQSGLILLLPLCCFLFLAMLSAKTLFTSNYVPEDLYPVLVVLFFFLQYSSTCMNTQQQPPPRKIRNTD